MFISDYKSRWTEALTNRAPTERAGDKNNDDIEVMEIDDDKLPGPSGVVEVPVGDDTAKTNAKDVHLRQKKPSSLLISCLSTPSSPVPKFQKMPKSPTTKTPQVPTKEYELNKAGRLVHGEAPAARPVRCYFFGFLFANVAAATAYRKLSYLPSYSL